MPDMSPQIVSYGDGALLIHYPVKTYDAVVCDRVQSLAEMLRASGNWREVVSGYDSILVAFNPVKTSFEAARSRLEGQVAQSNHPANSAGKTVEIPVAYGGEFGPDMTAIMTSSGLSEEQVVARHNSETYRVCMMGFIPGFAFLSAAPKALRHPRHVAPRAHVPAGSVGIAGWQTGIYGLDSPGGWQIIGRTPRRMFDKQRDQPFLLAAGDRVKFVPIDHEKFND